MTVEQKNEISSNSIDFIKKMAGDNHIYETRQWMDLDQDYWFQLRGSSLNLMVDIATPFVGMALNFRKLKQCKSANYIYERMVEDIKTAEVELNVANYDQAEVFAFRYILCAFIDESVLGTPWGQETRWYKHSLLARFHNETWGGEKVFKILSRLLLEPERYKDLLQFVYICLTLGFEGHYKTSNANKKEFERTVATLYLQLKQLDEDVEELKNSTKHVVAKKYKISKQLPTWTIFVFFGALLASIFGVYSTFLNNKTEYILNQLGNILN